jgi:hypothetical protein
MGLKQSIVFKSKFSTKTPGNYILHYTSEEEKTEPLEIYDYITQYTPRYSATEMLKQEGATELEVQKNDDKMTSKNGIMFGTHGLSYSEKMLKEAARRTQKATDEGHVPILQVVSFEHSYLVEKGIVPSDMPEPREENGDNYKGKVDQLKLRQAISDMTRKMHQDMGFSEPEWGATIHLDTQHVHVHLTTVETGQPKPKRLKLVHDVELEKEPRMSWDSEDKTSPYSISQNDEGFMIFKRNDEIIATQEATQKGNPKWYYNKTKTPNMIKVEKGKVSEKTFSKMRDTLDRSLSKTKDIKPFVKDIGEKRKLTKNLTLNTVYYNDVTVNKLQTLYAALPENKKMWRAGSNAKSMERAHEIASDIVEDIWTRHRSSINLDEFDTAVNTYADTRQFDEKFDDNYKNTLIANAYQDLKKESINLLYRDLNSRIKEDEKKLEVPKMSLKASSDDALKNEIVDNMSKNDTSTDYDNLVHFEYRKRSYNKRLAKSKFEKDYYKSEIDRYDQLEANNQTSKASKVVRNHYQNEYDYYERIFDKYSYLNYGEKSNVSKERFEEVKGTDLVNMLYDYGKNQDRAVPREVATKYKKQTEQRKDAINDTLDYLVETNQIEQYELMRNYRDSIRKEADVADQINDELKIPIPRKNGEDSIEKRKTIDTIQGRRLLKEELKELETVTEVVRKQYEIDDNNHLIKKSKKEKPPQIDSDKTIYEFHVNQQNQFSNDKWRYIQFEMQVKKQQQEEEEINRIREELDIEVEKNNEGIDFE